jgi:hypothetical protein
MQLLKQSAQEVKAFKKLCSTAFACEADAQQALTTFEQGLQVTGLHEITLCPRHTIVSEGDRAKAFHPSKCATILQGLSPLG